MEFRTAYQPTVVFILVASILIGCSRTPPENALVSTPMGDEATLASSATLLAPEIAATDSPLMRLRTGYGFPDPIDPGKRYMFYLHGKIIEDQGLPAISPEYGEYEYEAILERLASHGFVVISEQRPKNTDATGYARRIVEQITLLLKAGVPPESIAVVGASKGAGIAATVSNLLKNEKTNFVLLGFCSPDSVEELKQYQVSLYGNVLAVRDSVDGSAGSCKEFFAFSEGKGIGRHEEIVLHIGTGHGILYRPLDDWVLPTVQWARGQVGEELTVGQMATLSSLEKVDDYPLYAMYYSGPYTRQARSNETVGLTRVAVSPGQESCSSNWGCSLFAALGDAENRLYGRNFDWQFSPALLLFADPPDGYSSVSMVDMEYLGFVGDLSRNLTELPLQKRQALLLAPSLPFDGMNEKGLAVGMAAVPAGAMPLDPQKTTIDQLQVIREILDHAAAVEDAIDILGRYNIDMGSVPLHYLIASASGNSALVEFYKGEMVVSRNGSPWQVATNFLLASTNGDVQGQCWRYDLIHQRLEELAGRISSQDALHLLRDVSQDNTQWSIVYHMTSGDLDIVMGRDYSGTIHTFHLEQTAR